ncbi:IRX12 [Linum perenne]
MILSISMVMICLFCSVECMVRHYKFDVSLHFMQYHGPTIYAREDNIVLVEVINNVRYNMSIHWHGVRQMSMGWADWPSYIMQCPLQTGQSYVYNFTVAGQRGTLFWHAHILWLRATVHGAIVILPKPEVMYPFPMPNSEHTLIIGEWWKSYIEEIINEALKTGGAPNISTPTL